MNEKHPLLQELLVLRATEGLDEDQARQLARLLQDEGIEDSLDLELAAAAASNAFALRSAKGAEDAPQHLKDQLMQDADRFFAEDPVDDRVVPLRPRAAVVEERRLNWGWATAAVLAMVLLVGGIVNRDPTMPTASEARNALLAVEGTVTVEWAPPETADYASVRGDVVWNDERQEGYMLLSGMPVNDPGVTQYQLWVVDPARDANPVDGGVFDIPAGAREVIIPIDAKLAVRNPAAFAITREKPGGVVVSDGPLLVVASAG
ncbi:MAG: anti-sigma factor [Pseudomonadota bacterium]